MDEKIKKFNIYIEKLCDDILYIRSTFELYINIYNKKKLYNKEMNIAPAFFQTIIPALLESSIMSLARLYKGSNNEVTITSFLNFLEQNKCIFYNTDGSKRNLKSTNNIEEVIKKDKEIVESNKSKIDKLSYVRDKKFAHNDKKYYFKDIDVFKQTNLTIKEIRELIDMSEEFINHFSVEFNGCYNILEPENIFDIDNIFEILSEYSID